MTVKEAITVKEALLEGKVFAYVTGSPTPYLDSALLLCEAMGITKERLFASYLEPVPDKAYTRFKEYIRMRMDGIPVSYIRRKKEFYSLEFYVDERVLVPRPDTEILVDTAIGLIRSKIGEQLKALRHSKPEKLRLHDTCTGSGCIAIAVAYNCPEITVSASDISEDALAVCRNNCTGILGRTLPLYKTDLLSGLPYRYDIITANPPYLTHEEFSGMKKRGWPEPELALNGGKEGFDILDIIIRTALESLKPNGYLIVESSESQATNVKQHMVINGYEDVNIIVDLGGRNRVTYGRRTESE